MSSACDLGGGSDEPAFPTGAPVHLVDTNVGPSRPLPSGGTIELFFDRLLLPSTLTRQTFVLADLAGNGATPLVLYDPVARAVTLVPVAPLDPCQSYRVYFVQPGDAADTNGLRAIDGAPLAPSTPEFLEFPVQGTCAVGGDAGSDAGLTPPGTPTTLPAIDFCSEVLPVLRGACATCHGGAAPPAGLALSDDRAILATAINRVAQGANQGPRAVAQPPTSHFGLDMPIIDRGSGQDTGAPGDSWLVYKLLLTVPPSTPLAHNLHSRPWKPLADGERATLAQYVTGLGMPYPPYPALSLDELETLSFWIAQGAPLAACTGG